MIKEIIDKIKKMKNPVLANKQHANIEDITYVRNIQEKMASLNIGQCFALATRDGVKIFKLVEIRKYKEKPK